MAKKEKSAVATRMPSRAQMIATLLQIDNKERNVVPFVPNKLQQQFLDRKGNRNIILKARQMGMSCIILADMFIEAITVPNTTCVVISHEQHATERLLERIHFFYENFKEVQPQMGHGSASEISFPGLHSTIYIGTARSMTFGRGDRIDHCHLCLHPDTQILLAGGKIKPIKDIEGYIGKRPEEAPCRTYSAKRGQVTTISRTHSSSCPGQMLKATVAGNASTPLIATPNHKVLACGQDWRPLSEAKWIGAPIRPITQGRKKIGLEKRGKNRWPKTIDNYLPYDYDFGWFIGLYLAEGSLRTTGVTFSLNPLEIEYKNKIEQFMSKYKIGVTATVQPTHGVIGGREINGQVLAVDVNSASIKKIIEKLIGRDKVIPDWFWDCGVDFLEGIADGYIAGDGTSKGDKNYKTYVTSVRPWLLYQLREILLSLGRGYAGISYSPNRQSWVLYYPLQETSKGHSHRSVKFRTVRGHPYVFCRILKKDFIAYDGPMYDLQTRGSFQTPCGIVKNSELAFYDDASRIVNAIEEAVPLSGEITIESTPNGENNAFYEIWVAAREGRSGYIPFFFPWWVSDEYTLERGSEFALERDKQELYLDAEEVDLVEQYGLTLAQLRWRRRKMSDKQASLSPFHQEYPEDEVSCFIESGDPVFDPLLLNEYAKGCYTGTTHPQGWTTWLPPVEGMRYVIGADCSAGVERGSFSAASVLDEQYQVCATFQARLEPTQFAKILADLGKYYNTGQLAVERNAQGYAVLAHLTEYPNIYHQRDYTTGKETNKPGWWTSEATKAFMLTAFKDHLAKMKIWDVNLVRQARGYRYVKFKPTPQTFDDLLIATMVAVAVRQVLGGAKGFVGAATLWDW